MPHPICEPAGYAVAQMAEVLRYGDNFIDSAAERRSAIEKVCAESEQALLRANAELKASQDALRGLQGQLKAKGAVLEDQRNRSNATLDEQIARAQAEWAVLNDNIKKKRQAIADTEASAQSLIKRLSLG